MIPPSLAIKNLHPIRALAGGVFLFGLISSPCTGETPPPRPESELRLRDVFAGDNPTTASAVSLSDLDRNPELATELLQSSEAALEARNWHETLRQTEILLAWMNR